LKVNWIPDELKKLGSAHINIMCAHKEIAELVNNQGVEALLNMLYGGNRDRKIPSYLAAYPDSTWIFAHGVFLKEVHTSSLMCAQKMSFNY